MIRHQIHRGTVARALKPRGGAQGWRTTPRYCLPRSSFSLQVRLWEEAVFPDSKHSCACTSQIRAAVSGVKKTWILERRSESLLGSSALSHPPIPPSIRRLLEKWGKHRSWLRDCCKASLWCFVCPQERCTHRCKFLSVCFPASSFVWFFRQSVCQLSSRRHDTNILQSL